MANLAFLRYLAGDPVSARHVLSETLRDPSAQRRPYGYILALTTAALIPLDEDDLEGGESSAQRALEHAASAGLAENQVSGLAHVALGRALASAHRFTPAAEQLQLGLDLLRGGVMPAWHAYALLCRAPVNQVLGDHAGALALVDEAKRVRSSFEDAGTLNGLLHDVQRRISLGRSRTRGSDPGALSEAELEVLRALEITREPAPLVPVSAHSWHSVPLPPGPAAARKRVSLTVGARFAS
jgi:MalT-like TPR region